MVFSSVTFLFLFLPAVLLLYYLCPRIALRNGVLLLASLIFYSWGEGFYVFVLLVSILFNFIFGLLLSKTGKYQRTFLALGIAGNLLLLGTFKYAGFLTDNLNSLLSAFAISPLHLEPVHLPIGISFFTFQAISYLVDTHRRKTEAQRNPLQLALYISLFPQLIAGPIVRYEHIADQIASRRASLEDIAYGGRRFVIGLAKKVLIADTLGRVADSIYALPAEQLSPELAWLGVICFTLQIYFDFSGYSDMAIGLGRMFGFTFHENFNYPYTSVSIRDFWRRWHISLSTWFRDYLYIPLGGNRKGTARTHFNLILVFFLCGLWHGASWTFVIWGFYHGFFLVLERTGFSVVLHALPRFALRIYTLLVVVVGWVFFRSQSPEQALLHLASMFGIHTGEKALPVTAYADNKVWLVLCVSILASAPLSHWLYTKISSLRQGRGELFAIWAREAVLPLLFLLSAMSIAANTYQPFLYFRF